MENQNPSTSVSTADKSVGKKSKKRSENKVTLADIAKGFIRRDGAKTSCAIDPGTTCNYTQDRLDIGNFIRHFRTRHHDLAVANGLTKEEETPAKKQRVVAKRPVPIDKLLFMDSLVKLMSYHNMPLACLQWEGFKQLLDPLASAVGVTMNPTNMKATVKEIAGRIREAIAAETKGRLISLKIDSASRHNRHVLGINAQYSINDSVVIRTLGMLEIKERQTARFLKSKILEVVNSYGVGINQIFSVTCDNGANMLAAVRQLKQEIELLALDSEYTEEQDKEDHEFTTALNNEFKENLNLVRCAVHTLQLAILDVVDKSNASCRRVTDIAKKCKQIKYKPSFELVKASYPPVWGQTRWGGIFKMMQSFTEQENFFKELALQFPELDLSNDWEFIGNYVQAFKPLYYCTKNMQSEHVSLPDFYLQWLLAVMEVSKLTQNPFATPLTAALTNRIENLKTSRAFKMALYLDPRLNYMGSKLFTSDEKELIQNYIIETYKRISSYQNPAPSAAVASPATTETTEDDFDHYLTELFGECSSSTGETRDSAFLQQLKALEVEPRQNHSHDVWKHWTDRRTTHPELSAVASVVLATPSNQISVERAFSALALILTDHRSTLGEENLSSILLVKLNKDLFEEIMPSMCQPNGTTLE
ncbi:uncharacterized protein LOC135706932 [Ochlerotatus camptorhynchus]|uniref:uncharacterized protein LOC135706932 n=1 Tax=Ochlerotatus camptorhynchus TaxID=644619 RepID=UPI0031DFA573